VLAGRSSAAVRSAVRSGESTQAATTGDDGGCRRNVRGSPCLLKRRASATARWPEWRMGYGWVAFSLFFYATAAVAWCGLGPSGARRTGAGCGGQRPRADGLQDAEYSW
jgi:hypothetical protein